MLNSSAFLYSIYVGANSAEIHGKQANAKRDVVFLPSRNCAVPIHYLISANSREKLSARLWKKGL